jgi:hypothetical protein
MLVTTITNKSKTKKADNVRVRGRIDLLVCGEKRTMLSEDKCGETTQREQRNYIH